MFAKIIVALVLIAILASLASGLYFMMKDNDDSDRMVKALTWRIALSVSLFIFLMAGYYFGWFQPNSQLPY
jgi:FtsH-binding integral membrane protein